MTADLAAYFSLLLAAFTAATLLPTQSEAVLAGLLIAGQQPPAALIAVASIGNVAGSVINWMLGRGIERFRHRRWFPVSPRLLEAATSRYHRYGRWSLLLSWLPIVGDPLTLVAGVLREPFWSFLAIVAIAKTGRYIAVALIVSPWT